MTGKFPHKVSPQPSFHIQLPIINKTTQTRTTHFTPILTPRLSTPRTPIKEFPKTWGTITILSHAFCQIYNSPRPGQYGRHFAGSIFSCIFLKEKYWIFWFKFYMCVPNLQYVSICLVDSLRPSDTYMRPWTRPSSIQIMACRLTGTKPLSEPMLGYC